MAKSESRSEPHGPPRGWFDGHAHVFPIRVYYEDTDFSGAVYHANYLRFMERGRSEFLRAIGVRHQGMLKTVEPLVWVVRHISIDYDKPARVDDKLEVRSKPHDMSGARMRVDQEIWRGKEILIRAMVEVCVVTLDGRPRRIPSDIHALLKNLLVK